MKRNVFKEKMSLVSTLKVQRKIKKQQRLNRLEKIKDMGK